MKTLFPGLQVGRYREDLKFLIFFSRVFPIRISQRTNNGIYAFSCMLMLSPVFLHTVHRLGFLESSVSLNSGFFRTNFHFSRIVPPFFKAIFIFSGCSRNMDYTELQCITLLLFFHVFFRFTLYFSCVSVQG